MSQLRREHFQHPLNRFQKRDPRLFKELQEKLVGKEFESVLETAKKAIILDDREPLVDEKGVPTTSGTRIAETIVRRNARPVMIIRDNQATTEFLGPDSQVWADRVIQAQPKLDKVIPAVGRVELLNNPDYTWVGTAWLVDQDIVVTNRHVAREFGRLGSEGFIFRMGAAGGRQSARVDFLEEYQRSLALEFSVESILWIATPDEPDVSFLRVKRLVGGRGLASPVVLASAVAEDELVATIGYPAKDSRVPDQDLVHRVFGDVYEKKRLAPGQVIGVKEDELEHDCSTLGGNSGSPLISLATGEAVGLHFSGIFLTANYAVPAPKLRELLGKVQRAELPGMGPITVRGPRGSEPTAGGSGVLNVANSAQGSGSSGMGGTYTYRVNVPIEITVRVGAPEPFGAPTSFAGSTPAVGLGSNGTAASASDSVAAAVGEAQQLLQAQPDIVDIRPGYRFKRGWITDERVVVVEVRKKLSPEALRDAGRAVLPAQIRGIGVDVRTASLADQLESLGISLEVLEAPPRPGRYREPPGVQLTLVKEHMQAIFHVSPDSGFPNLKEFLGRTKKHLTATMYEWDRNNHISLAIESAMKGAGHSLRMVTQKKGTDEAVDDLKQRLGAKMKHAWASVGGGKLIPSAYHIKVVSRDGEEVWVSSGNWKDSNQPEIDPAGEDSTKITPQRKFNREWHAIIANKKLAEMFQKYIEWDFEEAVRVPFEEMLEVTLPDLFVPEEVFAEGAEAPVRAQYFDPLRVDKPLEIQPLLTPDRDDHGKRIFMAHAVKMMRKAAKTLYVQNQSFNLLEENIDEFEQFFTVLKQKQDAGVDVKVIFRDPREFGSSGGANLQKMLERAKDFGIDTDQIKVQRHCHTKGIIVDGEDVLLGSHNLTNAGGLFNRDASLLVRDPEVANYFEEIFRYDWKTLAVQESEEIIGDVRRADPGEPTPPGYRRVSASEALGLG